MLIHELQRSPGLQSKGKRLGRGNSNGKGNYSGKGMKGQKARTGGGIPLRFEWGQTPLFMRLPKYRGFKRPASLKKKFVAITLQRLERDARLTSGTEITKEVLVEFGYFVDVDRSIKIIATGSLTKSLHFKGIEKCSAGALKAIEKAKGSFELLKQ